MLSLIMGVAIFNYSMVSHPWEESGIGSSDNFVLNLYLIVMLLIIRF